MTSRVIRQGVSQDSLFRVIGDWCNEGAGKRNCRLRFLSAFASGGGVGAVVPLLDVFLAEGNTVEVIIGVDRQGTDRGALLHLDALLHAYPAQCRVAVFQAPARASIFHPKLYIFDAPGKRNIVAGSANLTAGGLGSNFESLIYYQDCGLTAPEVRHAEEIWSLFANPVPPLRREFLKPLTKSYLRALLAKLPTHRDVGEKSEDATFRELWRPLSRVPLPRSTLPKPRKHTTPEVAARRYLVMDVLNETRWTQMQVPLPVVEGFFGVEKRQSLDLHLSILTKTGLSQPIDRPLVLSQGQEGQRLMRRIEMPQIRDLERPLAVVFVKLSGRGRFAFKLIPKHSATYRAATRLLDREGQQGEAERRFIIGRPGDGNWKAVNALLSD